MGIIFSLRTYQLGFRFYKQFLLASLIITFIQYNALALMEMANMAPKIICGKLFFIGVLFLFYLMPDLNRKLVFYKNFGLSKCFLFVFTTLFDVLFTSILIKILNLF